MKRIEAAFREGKNQNQILFMPYITAGLPDLKRCLDLILELRSCGASILEIGIPFSDPVLDGKILQRANQLAILRGISTQKVLELVNRVREQDPGLAIVIMSYMNLVYQYGIERFFKDLRSAGADGSIIPDCPLEESQSCVEAARKNQIHPIYLLTPDTGSHRLKQVLSRYSGFLYCMSFKGVTGPRDNLPEGLLNALTRLKEVSPIPVAAGFGISNRAQYRLLSKACHGVIVGSALMEIVMEEGSGKLLGRIRSFVKGLRG